MPAPKVIANSDSPREKVTIIVTALAHFVGIADDLPHFDLLNEPAVKNPLGLADATELRAIFIPHGGIARYI